MGAREGVHIMNACTGPDAGIQVKDGRKGGQLHCDKAVKDDCVEGSQRLHACIIWYVMYIRQSGKKRSRVMRGEEGRPDHPPSLRLRVINNILQCILHIQCLDAYSTPACIYKPRCIYKACMHIQGSYAYTTPTCIYDA